MISLNDILNDPRFFYLKILSFDKHFDRLIQSIDSTETPDVEMYLKPKTLLLTTGMIYQNNQEQLISLIQRLNKADCSGLLIKLGRFVTKLDPKVIEMAEALNFPIIQIPLDMTLGDVYNQLLSYIWDNQNEQLTYAFNIQKNFHSLLLQGANIQDILETLGDMFKVDVALINPFHQIVAHSKKVLKHFSPVSLIELIPESIPSNPYASILIDTKEKTHHVVVELIKLNKSFPYYLVVVDPAKLAYPASSLAIDQVILTIAFVLNRNLNLEYQSLSSKELFFENLVNGEHEDPSVILNLGEAYQFIKADHYKVVTMNINVKEHSLEESIEQYVLIYNRINELIQHKDVVAFPNRNHSQISFIIFNREFENKTIIQIIHQEIQRYLNISVTFGIGSLVYAISQISRSYRESITALSHGLVDNDIPYLYTFSTLSTESIFYEIDKDQRMDYGRYILGDLLGSEHSELRKTLLTWLESNQDYIKSAKKLYIHRNTVRYRIEKCKEILNNDLDDANSLFELRIALKFTEMI